ncbi:MAG: zf-HC2 domain-containing protein [candidate division Zixibacteria bacterium]|nr:zf-HC2 domain-containing protein [candidate division Zixibacteria bacterium]
MSEKCLEYIADLNAFLDGDLPDELCIEIEKHVGECNNCKLMVDTLKMTVKLCREGKSEDLSPSLNDKLNILLKKKWNKKFGE